MFGVSIGAAAALYDLAPSTVRWWEHEGVLPEPERVGGRRMYSEVDLRRIGLAYLCCVTGAMPLDQAAVVTSGDRTRQWQGVVAVHAEMLAQRIEELRSAREYLLHLMRCPDEDVVAQCPDLDGELMRCTPRGRADEAGLVAAARALAAAAGSGAGNGIRRERDEMTDRCDCCGTSIAQAGRGRRRLYCSRACRQRAHRRRHGAG